MVFWEVRWRKIEMGEGCMLRNTIRRGLLHWSFLLVSPVGRG